MDARDSTRWRGVFAPILCALVWSATIEISIATGSTVALNEVHYHPADGSSEGEFVELFNHGKDPVDLGALGS